MENQMRNKKGNIKWTTAENTVCFYELKDYINFINSGSKSIRKRENYAAELINQYPIFSLRTPSALRQHFDYLNRVSIDEFSKDAKEDEVFRGILLMNNSYVCSQGVETPEPEEYEEELVDDFDIDDDDKQTDEYHFNLSDEEISSLTSFIGHGDFPKTFIAFLGNEGGLGNSSPRYNIDLLCNEFKKNNTNYFNEGNWKLGYWTVNNYDLNKRSIVPNSPFLYLTARILLALEDQESSVDDWFKKGDSKKLGKVKELIASGGLYSNKPGLKSALLDWRPLPRRDEKNYDFPYLNVDSNLYLKAFNFEGGAENPYNEWVNKRVSIFKNVLNKYHIPFLLSFGAVKSKLTLFKKIWPEIEFNEVTLEESNKTIYVSKEKVSSNTIVIATEFLDYQNLGLIGTMELVKFLKKNYM
ncbi:hypothetical protein [Lysinibacillus sp. IITD104]|uniref:hypothetical protein n=1 Tax=Lysinibacillus sp. IITD104 TaxID=3116650 RepID=UPI002FD1B41D